MSESVLAYLITLQIKAAMFAVLLTAALHGTKLLSSRDKYLALRIALVLLAILPLMQFVTPNYQIPVDWPENSLFSKLETVHTAPQVNLEPVTASEQAQFLATGLLIGYLLVAGILLLRLVVGFIRAEFVIRRYGLLTRVQEIDLLAQLASRLNIQPPELRVDDSGAGPYVWGVSRPVIAVPEEFTNVAEDLKRTVLTHELIHVQRHDALTCIAAKLLCCLYWINPTVWLLERRLKLEMEKSCDQQALSLTTSAADYAEQLLQAVKRFHAIQREPHCAVSMARASSLQQRIQSLLATHEQRGNMSNSKLAIFGAGLLGAAMAIGAGTTTPTTTTVAAVQQEATTQSFNRTPETDRAAYAAIQDRISRMASDTGSIKLSKLSVAAFMIDMEGKTENVKGIQRFMRALDEMIGAPHLHFVKKSADGSYDFRISLKNFDRYVPDSAAR